jgi:hypothetical protein
MSFPESMIIEEEATLSFRQQVEANPKIRLVDSDPENHIDLFCYETCDESDDDIVKSCRGIVFDKDKVVFRGFSFTPEYTLSNDSEKINSILSSFPCKIYDSYEGTLLRIFCHNNKWYISTNRKLDANKSKWGSKTSFGEYFKQALEYEIIANAKFRDHLFQRGQENPTLMNLLDKFFDKLDSSKKYTFLLLTNKETRIVCQYENPKILHVGTFNEDNHLSCGELLGLDFPKELYFETIESMYHYINTIDFTTLQGLIVFNNDFQNQFKIMNQKYLDLYTIRGNESSVKFRYLQLRNDPIKRDTLRGLYLNHCYDFDYYEQCLSKITDIILEAYINRYIRKQYVVLPLEQFIVMSEVHKWYMTDRDCRKVSRDIITLKINEQTPVSLNRMIKKYILSTKNTGLINLKPTAFAM